MAIAPTRAEPPLVLAVDVGSSSVRALVFDRLGRSVDRLRVHLPYEMRVTPDGGVEVEADLLVRLVATAVDRVLDRAGRRRAEVEAVALSTFWHSLLGIGADGRPLTPVLSWADTRSRAAAETLRRRLDERAVHGRTGCRLHPSYLPAKLLWLSQARPDRFLAIDRILRDVFPQTREAVASGGGLLNSPAWMQVLADVLGRPVVASAEPEASSRGAALMALAALGLLRLHDARTRFGRRYHPRKAAHERYQEAFSRQARLYDLLASLWEDAGRGHDLD